MKAAIISSLATLDISMNQTRNPQLASDAFEMGAKLIIFTEAAATGLINSGNPDEDYMVAARLHLGLSMF
jgi:hypothetical protein